MNLQGKILGAELASPVSDAKVTLTDQEQNTVAETVSDVHGYWQLNSDKQAGYLHVDASGYIEKNIPAQALPHVIRLLEDKLVGYQDKLWFQPGETINVYVHSSIPYCARLFRHGLEKKFILDLGEREQLIQSVPDGCFVDKGLDWKIAFQYVVPEDALPGIYSLLLSSVHYENFAIPMLVSTPKNAYGAKSKILVLASTNNWISYNTWGGRSRYRNFEEQISSDFLGKDELNIKAKLKSNVAKFLSSSTKELLKKYILRQRQSESQDWVYRKLSIRRPFVNCGLEEECVFQPFTNHLAAGEWRVLAWLEREGFEYDIVSGYELDHNPNLLENFKVIIFSTHCEYWSRKMYESVKKYHQENGLWLLNLSGNTMFREVDFYEDGSHRCVSLKFSESVADETQLLGVRFTMDDYSTCAPYKIMDNSHWVFNKIPINKKTPYFGGESLNQNTPKQLTRYDPGRPGLSNGLQGFGASGWETDKLSKTAPSDMKLIAKGCNKHGGADMLVRDPKGKRGGLFTASSLTFGGSLLIDTVSSMITKNILNTALNNKNSI